MRQQSMMWHMQGGCAAMRTRAPTHSTARCPRLPPAQLNAPQPEAPPCHCLLQVVPENVVAAAVDMNVLGLITFSLMFGLALSSLGELDSAC